MKNIPAELLRSGGKDGQLLIKDAVPMFYINRYKTHNQRLRTFSERVIKFLRDAVSEAVNEDGDIIPDSKYSNIEVGMSDQIFVKILSLFDSNMYEERISAALAMEDLCIKL